MSTKREVILSMKDRQKTLLEQKKPIDMELQEINRMLESYEGKSEPSSSSTQVAKSERTATSQKTQKSGRGKRIKTTESAARLKDVLLRDDIRAATKDALMSATGLRRTQVERGLDYLEKEGEVVKYREEGASNATPYYFKMADEKGEQTNDPSKEGNVHGEQQLPERTSGIVGGGERFKH